VNSQAEIFYAKASYEAGHALTNLGSVTGVLFVNGIHIAMTYLEHFVTVSPSNSGMVLALFLLALFLIGLCREIRHGLAIAHIWLLVYCAMLLLWLFPPGRFLTVILPLMLLFAWKSFDAVCSSLRSPLVKSALVSGALFVMCLDAAVNCATLSEQVCESRSRESVTAERVNWVKALELFDWIRANTPETALLGANTLDPSIYLLTGRQSLRLWPQDFYSLHYSTDESSKTFVTPSKLRQTLIGNGLTHLVIMPMSGIPESGPFYRALATLLLQEPYAFSLVKRLDDINYRVYAFDPSKLRLPSSELRALSTRSE
jgi:hypothetical protein